MAVLIKRINASSLMETLVATILLIVIFMISSFTMNSFFGNAISYDQHAVTQHLYELEYKHQHKPLLLPYVETYKNWDIHVFNTIEGDAVPYITFKATHKLPYKMITKMVISHAQNP